jgi:hypothetical protein
VRARSVDCAEAPLQAADGAGTGYQRAGRILAVYAPQAAERIAHRPAVAAARIKDWLLGSAREVRARVTRSPPSPSRTRRPHEAPPLRQHRLVPWNFRVAAKELRGRGWDVVLVSPPGDYHKRIESAGFRWVGMDLSRTGMNPLQELTSLRQLIKLYRKERPDVAHHFTVKCVLYGGVAATIAGTRATVSSMTGLGHLFTTDTTGPASPSPSPSSSTASCSTTRR